MLRATGCAGFALLLALAAGCGGGHLKFVQVTRYPTFYQPELKRVAVIQFRNQTGVPEAGEYMSRRLEIALTTNKTYDVYSRQNLKDVLTEQDLSATDLVAPETAQRIGKLTGVQAIICGVCSRYAANTRLVTVKKWIYVPNGRSYIAEVPATQHEALVECNVVVIDAATGQQIAAVHAPAPVAWVEGTPAPWLGTGSVLQYAEMLSIAKVVQEIAVTRKLIRLGKEVLRTATGEYDAKPDCQDRFVPADTDVQGVVTLPAEACRNTFKLTIVRKNEREDLADQEFVWAEGSATEYYKFPIATLVEKGGYGLYTMKLYSGHAPIAWHDFEILQKR